jgi:hypothetical protein
MYCNYGMTPHVYNSSFMADRSGNNGDMRNGCKIMLGILMMTGYWEEIVEVARFY